MLCVYLKYQESLLKKEVIYRRSEIVGDGADQTIGAPFGSRSGKTYTFSWCQGATRISPKNKIIFKDEQDAIASGRTLSKLCK